MVRTKQQRKRNRRKLDPAAAAPPATTAVVSVTHSSGAGIVVFASPIQLSGTMIPSTWTIDGNPVTAAVQISATSISVTTGTAIIATNPYIFPAFDPAVRTPSGGYVDASVGTVA